MTDIPALLPCPFCGWDAIIYEWDETQSGELVHFYQPRCSSCECKLDNGWYEKDDAIEEWNRREKQPMIKSEKLQRYISTDLGEVCLADNVTELEAVNDELWQAIKALTTNHEAARKEWEAKEKALRALAERWNWLAYDLNALLNTHAAGGKEQP